MRSDAVKIKSKTKNQYIVDEIHKTFLKSCDHTSSRAISENFQKLKMHRYPEIVYVGRRQPG